MKNFCFLFKKTESVAYEFGSNKGMIQYMFPPGKQPDTEEDSIALGFITTKSDAVLLRIESSTTQDYMELEIVINVITLYACTCTYKHTHTLTNGKHLHMIQKWITMLTLNSVLISIPIVTG